MFYDSALNYDSYFMRPFYENYIISLIALNQIRNEFIESFYLLNNSIVMIIFALNSSFFILPLSPIIFVHSLILMVRVGIIFLCSLVILNLMSWP